MGLAHDRVLDRRRELLESERKSQERYRDKLRGTVDEVQRALQHVTGEIDQQALKELVTPRRRPKDTPR